MEETLSLYTEKISQKFPPKRTMNFEWTIEIHSTFSLEVFYYLQHSAYLIVNDGDLIIPLGIIHISNLHLILKQNLGLTLATGRIKVFLCFGQISSLLLPEEDTSLKNSCIPRTWKPSSDVRMVMLFRGKKHILPSCVHILEFNFIVAYYDFIVVFYSSSIVGFHV